MRKNSHSGRIAIDPDLFLELLIDDGSDERNTDEYRDRILKHVRKYNPWIAELSETDRLSFMSSGQRIHMGGLRLKHPIQEYQSCVGTR